MNKKQAIAHIGEWTREHIDPPEQEPFQEAAETELLSLHEGNSARYRITPGEFAAWYAIWKA